MLPLWAIKQRIQSELSVSAGKRLGAEIAATARLIGRPVISITPGSKVRIGHHVRLISDSRRTALGVNHPVTFRTLTPSASLTIGDHVGMSGGSICAAEKVEIGEGSLLGANVTIVDTDFHPIVDASRRYAQMPDPKPEDAVIIGQNVFIGTGAIILKGTKLGDNCVVGAGSVVTSSFSANTLIAGNPARALRTIEPSLSGGSTTTDVVAGIKPVRALPEGRLN